MLRKGLRKYLLLLVFCLSLVFVSVGDSMYFVDIPETSYTINNVDETGGGVAYVKNGNTTTTYTSLARAITEANKISSSSPSIYVVPGKTANLTNVDLTLNSGVSLYVPYEGEKWNISDNSELEDESTYRNSIADGNANGVKNYRVSLINFVNASLTVKGNLYLGGVFFSYGVCGKYCEINLDKNSSLTIDGTFYCYGYVKENASDYVNANQKDAEGNYLYPDDISNACDPNRFLKIGSAAKVYIPLSIYDPKTGGTLYSYYNAGVCMFNIFEFSALQTYVSLDYGAQLLGNIRLRVGNGDSQTIIADQCGVIGPSSSSPLFIMTGEGTCHFEYCPGTNAQGAYSGYTAHNLYTKTRLYLTSNIQIGSLSFSYSGMTIDTKDYFLPISYKYSIFVADGATLSMTNRVKLLAGSALEIYKGGTLSLSSELIAEKSNSMEGAGTGYPTSGLADAVVMNNGTISLTGSAKIGAYISTESSDDTALLVFDSVSQANLSVTSPEGAATKNVIVTSSGPFFNEEDESISDYQFYPGKTTNSDPNGHQCWVGDRYAVYTVSVKIDDIYDVNVGEYTLSSASSDGGTKGALTDENIEEAKSVEVIRGQYVVIDFRRCESASFADGTAVTSGAYYQVMDDMEITIKPYDGVYLRLETESESGAGSTTYKVYESAGSSNGSYSEIANFTTGGVVKLILGRWFYVDFTGGFNSSFSQVQVDYITNGDTSTAISYYSHGTKYSINNLSQYFGSNSQYKKYLRIFTYIKSGSFLCISGDTPVLMADGTEKCARDIELGDVIASYDHYEGKFEHQPVILKSVTEKAMYEVLDLKFSDGTNVETINGHCFFSQEEGKYTFLHPSTVENYVGQHFYSLDQYGNERVLELVDYEIYDKYTEKCGFASYENINGMIGGMLSIPEGVEDIFNFFEVEPNSLKFDEEKFNADIEKYGVYSYEDVAHKLTKVEFDEFNFKYVKTAIGKGITTEEKFDWIISFYLRGGSGNTVEHYM